MSGHTQPSATPTGAHPAAAHRPLHPPPESIPGSVGWRHTWPTAGRAAPWPWQILTVQSRLKFLLTHSGTWLLLDCESLASIWAVPSPPMAEGEHSVMSLVPQHLFIKSVFSLCCIATKQDGTFSLRGETVIQSITSWVFYNQRNRWGFIYFIIVFLIFIVESMTDVSLPLNCPLYTVSTLPQIFAILLYTLFF